MVYDHDVPESKGTGHLAVTCRSQAHVPPCTEEIPIRAGHLEAEFDPDHLLYGRELVLGGRRALAREVVRLDDASSGTILADWLYQGQLDVFDDGNGQRLSGVQLIVGAGADAERCEYPPPRLHSRALHQEGEAPLSLPVLSETGHFWVGADGYAWKQVVLAADDGQVGPVRLGWAGELEIHAVVLDAPVALQFTLRDRARPERLITRWRAAERMVLEGVPEGRYVLETSHPRLEGPMRILDRREVEVRATARTSVQFAVSLFSEELGELAGILELPPLQNEVLALTLHPKDLGTPRSVHAEVLRFDTSAHKGRQISLPWRFTDLVPGPWTLRVEPFGWQQEVLVRAGCRSDVPIRLPVIGETHVVFHDQRTGQSVRPDAVAWRPAGHPEEQWVSERVDEDEALRFQTVTSVVEILVSDPRYLPSTTVHSLHGETRLQIPLVPADLYTRRLQVRLHGRVTTAPLGFWTSIRVKPLDSDGEVVQRTFSTGSSGMGALHPSECRLYFSRKGRYRLEFSALPGFQELPELLIEVQDGEPEAVRIALEPAVP